MSDDHATEVCIDVAKRDAALSDAVLELESRLQFKAADDVRTERRQRFDPNKRYASFGRGGWLRFEKLDLHDFHEKSKTSSSEIAKAIEESRTAALESFWTALDVLERSDWLFALYLEGSGAHGGKTILMTCSACGGDGVKGRAGDHMVTACPECGGEGSLRFVEYEGP